MHVDLRGARVTVMGLGRFGGGVGATRFLAEQGARVTVTDRSDEITLDESLVQIADLKLERLRLGGHDPSDFRDADLIVANPAVPPSHPLLVSAKAAGVPVTTEIGLFWSRCCGRVVGVTGSVGKSTTAAMIEAILTASGRRTWLGGNIGGSLLQNLDEIAADDWVVLELSSFQLEYLAPLEPRPDVAVVTNLLPNHLDRHGTLAAYRAAKQTLLHWQTSDDIAVLNADDPDVSQWPTAAQVWRIGVEPTSLSPARRSGRVFVRANAIVTSHGGSETPLAISPAFSAPHLLFDAAAAAAAASAIGVAPNMIANALSDFTGLPHRLQTLGEFAGRLWVNDSKATTPEATIAALESFDGSVRLIAGGADKGVDLRRLADAIVRRGASVHLSGRTAPAIAALLVDRNSSAVTVHESFDESVSAAWAVSHEGDVILLSPACASWGQFRDYRERGDRFAWLAGRLTGTHQEAPTRSAESTDRPRPTTG